jgi:hypothetical protein
MAGSGLIASLVGMRFFRTMLVANVVIAGLLSSTLSLAGESSSCFSSLNVPNWSDSFVNLSQPGASRPGPDNDLEVCAQGGGFQPTQDAFHHLYQGIAGDFDFHVVVKSLDNDGQAALMARLNSSKAESAGWWVTVHRTPGGLVLSSAIRFATGEDSQASLANDVPVQLPITLKVQRTNSLVTTSFQDQSGSWVHLEADVSGTELALSNLSISLAATSDNSLGTTATFASPGLAAPIFPSPDPNCLEAKVAPPNVPSEMRIRGMDLKSVYDVQVGGVSATIIEQTPTELRFIPNMAAGTGAAPAWFSAPVVVVGSSGKIRVPSEFVFRSPIGIIGDLDGDQAITENDSSLLMNAVRGQQLPASAQCFGVGDVDNDGKLTSADIALLRQAVSDPSAMGNVGLATCLGNWNPLVSSVEIPSTQATVAEGDVVTIRGKDLLPDYGTSWVLFDDVVGEIQAGSTATELRVKVIEVPSSGTKCPSLFRVSNNKSPNTSLGYRQRREFGDARVLEQEKPSFCPSFVANNANTVTKASYDSAKQRLFIPIDYATWNPSQPIEINLQLLQPLTKQTTRGSRWIQTSFTDTRTEIDEAGYSKWLTTLAKVLSTKLNGSSSEDCQCDFHVEAVPSQGGIAVVPCEPLDVATPGPGPLPGPDMKVAPPKLPIWKGVAIHHPTPKCDGEEQQGSRKHGWCLFKQVTDPKAMYGKNYPTFESFVPLVMAQGQKTLENDPVKRSTDDKFLLVDQDAASYVGQVGDYHSEQDDPDAASKTMAARVTYCTGGRSEWTPPFARGQVMLKTFWRKEGELPKSSNPNDFYSYIPSGQYTRKYLVGMHIATATGDIGSYWNWATFWMPIPKGETLRKDNKPLLWGMANASGAVYNPSCLAGGNYDQVQGMGTKWKQWQMCINSNTEGNHVCGNPWGPTNECGAVDMVHPATETQTCAGCHANSGIAAIPFEHLTLNQLGVAWIANFNHASKVKGFFDEIGNTEKYKEYTPVECK